MNHRTVITTALLALVGASSLAGAQIMPPPPEKAPAPEKQIPIQPAPGNTIPPMSTPTIIPANPRRPAPVKLPDLPYQSLVQKDQKGNVVRLSEPAEYAALRRNPMLKPEEVASFDKYLQQRKAAFEPIVADNLDLVEQIEQGVFETIDVNQNENFAKLLNVGKPLKAPAAPKPVWEDLRDRQMLSPEQAEFNKKISKEYYDALIAELNGDMRRNLAMSYKQYLDEPLYYHRLLLIEAAPKAPELIQSLELQGDTATQVRAIAQTAKNASNDQDRLGAMNKINQLITLDQRKALLRAVIAGRSAK